jgi:hypothetical protein
MSRIVDQSLAACPLGRRLRCGRRRKRLNGPFRSCGWRNGGTRSCIVCRCRVACTRRRRQNHAGTHRHALVNLSNLVCVSRRKAVVLGQLHGAWLYCVCELSQCCYYEPRGSAVGISARVESPLVESALQLMVRRRYRFHEFHQGVSSDSILQRRPHQVFSSQEVPLA